jgi:hypothetical protein
VKAFNFVVNDEMLSTQKSDGLYQWKTHSPESQDLVSFRLDSREFRPNDRDHDCECPAHRPDNLTYQWCTVKNQQCRCEGKLRNLGNWGIVYHYSGTIKNCTSHDLSFAFHVGATEAPIVIALSNGRNWESTRLVPGNERPYYVVDVKKGATTDYNLQYVIGGPSGSRLKNFVTAKIR